MRGGFRPNAGRPKKGHARAGAVPRDIRRAAAAEGMSPLDYMLAVMRNPEADQARRDRMAIAAAPFVHGKATDTPGKKDQARAAAETAGHGTDWGDDLIASDTLPN